MFVTVVRADCELSSKCLLKTVPVMFNIFHKRMSQREESQCTKHLWSFTAKQWCSTLLNNRRSCRLVLKYSEKHEMAPCGLSSIPQSIWSLAHSAEEAYDIKMLFTPVLSQIGHSNHNAKSADRDQPKPAFSANLSLQPGVMDHTRQSQSSAEVVLI